ncbi:MAG: PAS domain S-box protein, partial [Chloroflexi bacterium]|nr:PAS domain S-box protein [Chloroflexota bacterium]
SATLYSSYERPEARTAALLLLIVAVLGLLYLLVVFTVDRDLAFIFVRLRFGVITASYLTFFVFALQYTGSNWLTARKSGLILIVPLLIQIVLWTYPDGFFAEWTLVRSNGYSRERITFSIGYYFHWIYSLLFYFSGVAMLVNYAAKVDSERRKLITLLVIGIIVSLVTGSTTFAIGPAPGFRVTPLGASVCGLCIAWAVNRQRVFRLLPVAYDVIFQSMRDAVLVLDNFGLVSEMNQAAHAIWGAAADQFTGQPVGQLLPDVVPLLSDPPADQSGIELKIVRTDKTVYYHATAHPLAHRMQRSGWLVILRNITGRKSADEELRRAYQRYDELVRNVPAMVYIFRMRSDGSFVFDFVSDRCQEMNGYLPAELYQNADLALLQIMPEHRAEHLARIRQSAARLTPFRSEVLKNIDGKLCWRQYFSTPQRADDGCVVWHGIELDITDRKEAENKALELMLERERSEILLRFIRDASHEFRTPLTNIKTSLYLIERQDDAEKRRYKFSRIEQDVDRITELVNDLQTMARLDSHYAYTATRFDLLHTLQQICSPVRLKAETKNISFECIFPDQALIVSGDENDLQRALWEVIENAIRFSPEGGVAKIEMVQTGTKVNISIQDTGPGMDEETQRHIFERFYRKDEAHTTVGFGLGLPIAKKVIETHGGTILVESAPGAGATFKITLPLAE